MCKQYFRIETYVGSRHSPNGWWPGEELYRSEERATNAARDHRAAEVMASANTMTRRVVPA